MKRLSYVFTALAILLSDVMCAVVAYTYCALDWAGRYTASSCPAYAAFLYVIPYGIGITVCVAFAIIFHRKSRSEG